jgi:CubicO group peptidase (beta-lactamase class C family)
MFSIGRVVRSFAAVGAIALAAGAGSVAEAGQARVNRMVAAFENWAIANDLDGASIAVIDGGRVAQTDGYGTYDADNVSPLGSLSKAVTAICAAKLIEAGKFTIWTRIGDLLPAYFAAHPPADARVRDIIVGQLIAHASGMTYDPTQGKEMAQFAPFTKPSLEAQMTAAFSRKLSAKEFVYNNANYVALGYIIETVTGETHDAWCGEHVLKPIGITTARMNPVLLARGPYGAWMMSAADYARFTDYFILRTGLLHMTDREWPKSSVSKDVIYSFGTFMRRNGNGYNFWHDGAYSAPGGPSYGAYTVRWNNGAGYVATFTPRPSQKAVNALANAMGQAGR